MDIERVLALGQVLFKKLQSKSRKILWPPADYGLARIQMFSGLWVQGFLLRWARWDFVEMWRWRGRWSAKKEMEFVFPHRSQYIWLLPMGGPAHCHRSGGRESGTTMVGTGVEKDIGGPGPQKTSVWVLKYRCRSLKHILVEPNQCAHQWRCR